jgi:two-component sensor histidine kinase
MLLPNLSFNGIAVAIVMFAVALALRFALDGTLPPGFPYLTFFPAVIVTAFVGGVPAGILCAMLSGLAAWYWFIPGDGFALDAQSGLALGFYIFIVGVDIALIHAMNVAMSRLEKERALSSALAEQQGTMFEELQHRVANNMAFVASLLNMSKRRIAADPAVAPLVIEEARARIDTMARIHRRLHDPSSVDVPVRDYIQQLCADVIALTGRTGIACFVEAPVMTLDIRRLTTLSLFVSEVVTNSIKHGFPDGRTGHVRITLERLAGDRLALTIADDGVGWTGENAPSGQGLGMRIIKALATQLKGEVDVTGEGGATTRLEFPA